MNDVFSYIWGQERVREFFRKAASAGALSQSYLFYGPAGSGKTRAAYAVAAAALCEAAGCNECETCKRVMRKTHPDVHFYDPAGARAYLVEQMREIIADVQRAPILAKGSVYIINRADLLNAASANAFLKTLEEPPAHTTFILIARTKDSVLQTLVSRCVAVPFSTLPARVSVGLVEQNAKVGQDRAAQALSACSGSVEAAITFARKNKNFDRMKRVFDCMAALEQADAWDILKMSKQLVENSSGMLDEMKAAQEEYAEYNKDYMNATMKKKLRDENKRAQTRAVTAAHVENLNIMRSWLQDVMMLCVYGDEGTSAENAAPHIINKNVTSELRHVATRTNASRVARALLKIDNVEQKLNCNVSAQSCTDALLFELKVELYDANSTSKLVV